jgi:hypothetical protein
MSTASLDTYPAPDALDDQPLQYRAIPVTAIIGLALGVLSVFMMITAASSLEACLLVTPIPVLGIFVSLVALGKIRRESDQYTGSKFALAGLALSLVFLVAGIGYGGYIYATEVPEGYERISFNAMKPDELQERANIAVPPEIVALNGKKVFIKGYIRPGSAAVRTGIDRFLLVRDNNQCCFGDLSKVKYYDQMAVEMTGPQRVNDSLQLLRLGGVLQINPENLRRGPGYPVFSLKADYAN